MIVKMIRRAWQYPDSWLDAQAGRYLDHRHYDLLISGRSLGVLKPDGSLLLKYLHDVLPAWTCHQALPALLDAAVLTDNRGTAAGGGWRHNIKLDGTVSGTRRANPVYSGIGGYFDRTSRHPYCRTTAFTARYVDQWRFMRPFITGVNDVFAEHCPERYAAQMEVVSQTHPYWIIPDTAFTTVTVNRNFRTAVHKDEGDLAAGFGVMAVVSRGNYSGCYLVFPKYGVAVDMRDRGVLLADVHEWHGNTELVGTEGAYDRVTGVFYYRSGMRHCLSPEAEYARR